MMFGHAPIADEATSDITRSEVARALYLYAPCSAATIASVVEARGGNARSVESMLDAMIRAGKVRTRMIGDVQLLYLTGAGVG